MRKKLINFLCCFVPVKKIRKKIRKKCLELNNTKQKKQIEDLVWVDSLYYGKIYMPYYPNVKFIDCYPEIYNKEGKKMETFFIRDKAGSHCPHNNQSKYFLWDRFNIGLDTHFYTHRSVLETMGKPLKKYAYFVETESIIPDDYKIFEKNEGLNKEFDAIFTYSEKLLNTYENAKFFNGLSCIWYGREQFFGEKDNVKITPDNYLNKTKNVSMICSDKNMTIMHKIRQQIAMDALKTNQVDVYGKFVNKPIKFKSETLKEYRFQIVVENDVTAYNWTEKIMDCFASMTIPLYIGARQIDKFFNVDGIIDATILYNGGKIEDLLKLCTISEYEDRLFAVKENYERSLKYLNINDLLYENYFMNKN